MANFLGKKTKKGKTAWTLYGNEKKDSGNRKHRLKKT